ncbi:MAG: ABC transporter substrate-binding protein, partial [Clostridiales bacterium]|nr:ABC transporter substrate-binding protein [Clostridiales bacterium]
MKKKLIALMLAFAMIFALAACGSKEAEEAPADLSSTEWDQIVEQAKGTDVAFYGWGGDENRNNWLNGTV